MRFIEAQIIPLRREGGGINNRYITDLNDRQKNISNIGIANIYVNYDNRPKIRSNNRNALITLDPVGFPRVIGGIINRHESHVYLTIEQGFVSDYGVTRSYAKCGMIIV